MNKIFGLLFLILGAFLSLQSQQHKSYAWGNESEFRASIEKLEGDENEVVLKRLYSVEFFQDGEESSQYVLIHTVKWVNDDEAIKANNKIYLNEQEGAEYLMQKARVIKPNGEIKELKESDIKEGVYENEEKYHYFAVEGIEKGSIIETISYEKSRPFYYGSLVYAQEDIPRYNQEFELIAPPHLVFAFKSLNAFDSIQFDTTYAEGNRWSVFTEYTEKLEGQPFMYTISNRKAIVYKLDKNTYSGVSDITAYGNASQNVFQNLHPELSKSEKKQLDKLMKTLKLSVIEGDEGKIKTIENHLKSNFQIVNANHPDLENIDFIFNNKITNSDGIIILMGYLFDQLDIDYQLVLTCGRERKKFPQDFESYLYLEKYLVYFPKLDLYMNPASNFDRLGYFPSNLSHNYGLFIKEISVGGLKTALGKIKFIEALPEDKTYDKIYIDVQFGEDVSTPNIQFRRELFGFAAEAYQPYMYLLDEERVKEIKTSLVDMIEEGIEFDEVKIENDDQNDFGSKPFIYEFSTVQHPFIEKAGNDIILKLGKLIGPQYEMYQEEERKHDVEQDHNRFYYREIKVEKPEGYSIENLETLNYAYYFPNEEKPDYYFSSQYEDKGDFILITSSEGYSTITVPKEDFEDFRKVINAAADFNKISLILEKKQ